MFLQEGSQMANELIKVDSTLLVDDLGARLNMANPVNDCVIGERIVPLRKEIAYLFF